MITPSFSFGATNKAWKKPWGTSVVGACREFVRHQHPFWRATAAKTLCSAGAHFHSPFPARAWMGIPRKPPQLRSHCQAGRGQKTSKMGLNRKIKLIVLSPLFLSVFRSLLADLKKKNQNKFYRLRMIILKVYMYFFCFNFLEIGNIFFFHCPPIGGTSGPCVPQAAGSSTNLADETNK